MADNTQARTAKGAEPPDDLNALKADIAALKTELEGVVKAIKGLGANAVAVAKRQQGAAVEHLTEEAQSLVADIGATGRTQVAEFEQRIRDQPLMAVGIAFAVGLVLGSLRR